TSKDNGAVVVQGGVGIEKNLNVGGSAVITGNTTTNNLNVNVNASVNGNTSTATLDVSTSAHISTKLVVDGLNTLGGGDGSSVPYPLVVQGSNQGIWVSINESRTTGNNFVTFVDPNGVQGRIEGQTLAELTASEEYTSSTTVFAIEIAGLATDVVALGAEAATVIAQVLTAAEAVSIGAQAAGAALQLAGLSVEYANYINRVQGNVGVAYESGSGDYAEWLERAELDQDMHYGQIVGVKGGKISLDTKNADHYMVVSKSPIVLGNMPRPNEESNYEKVAFMGQVPVHVVGKVNIGDYLLPSGNNDGMGIAVSKENMKIGDYARIVGVAWQATGGAAVNYVNVAVGINSNDLTSKVEALNKKVDNIMAFLEGKAALLDNPVAEAVVEETNLGMLFSEEEFDRFLDNNAARLNLFYSELRTNLKAQGVAVESNPELVAYFDRPIEMLKQLRRDPALKTMWGSFDQKLKNKVKE
ncbi:MAG: hypothetical protein SGI94_18800, partial [Saprospiraceae bacterium]|nr:hypothetical protein [Saprospiraceae bacterium]